jgi:hypothetical protein
MSQAQIGITTQNQWDQTWPQIFSHYQQDLRHAYYVNAFLGEADERVLEMGAGSFRDMALLNRLGVDCSGTDFSQASVDLAKQQFPELSEKIFQGDAFKLSSLADGAFDTSFHNGLWVLFGDDEVSKLVAEQARVSRRTIMATVHNAHNPDFVAYFARLAETDPLYRIRFFEMEEMRAHMLKVCRSVLIVPVGKGKKFYEDEMINQGKASRSELRAFFDQVGMDHLATSERLLCIGQL